MTDSLLHRGPDEYGSFVSQGIELGMRRLAIIDVISGQQPAEAADGLVKVIFNGEIYNFRELRTRLEGLGHRFTSNSDTEVIAVGYLEWGVSVVQELAGMFAAAIYDHRDTSLHLVRDRIGKKPLVYGPTPSGGVVFASECRAILASGWKPEPDFTALNSVLAVGYTPIDGTAYRGLKSLPPGHILSWKSGLTSLSRFWTAGATSQTTLSGSDALTATRDAIETAVNARLVSERPMGAFLSGGIDSTIVTALMVRNSTEKVKTFTVAFADSAYDESPYAEAIAKFLNTQHHCLRVNADPDVIAEVLPTVFDQPFADSSSIPTYLLSKFAREHVVVALGGDGGDESFGGYVRYQLAPMLQDLNILMRAATPIGKYLQSRGYVTHNRRALRLARALRTFPSLRDRYVDLMLWATQSERDSLWTPELKNEVDTGAPEQILQGIWDTSVIDNSYDRMMLTDINSYLPGDLLVKADIASMANSLELRSPFLDHKVMDVGLSIDPRLRVSPRGTKLILKRIAAELVPAALIERPKMGFGIPRAAWIRGPLRGLVHDILSPAAVNARGWFDSRTVRDLLQSHDQGLDRSAAIWPLLMIELWAREWLDRTVVRRHTG